VSADPARHLAAQLERRGLAAPARLLIDAHLPLAPLLSDLGAALGPLIRVAGSSSAFELVRLLDDDDGMEGLVAALDDVGEPHAKPG